MAWLNPAALWALALVAGPIVVHLLRRRRAPRVQFPSLRFIRPSPATSVRLRPPADWLLLLLRCATVALASCAIAQPLLLTPSRLAAWNARFARAAVVDTSESMRAVGAAGASAEAELQDASAGSRIDTPDLADGLARAVAWLEKAPPARQEIVLVSDFQAGSLDAADLNVVPSYVGLKLVALGSLPSNRLVEGAESLGAPGHPARRIESELSTSNTRAIFTSTNQVRSPGLRIVAGENRTADVETMHRALAEAGSAAPSSEQPLVVRFAGANAVRGVQDGDWKPWMLQTILRLGADDALLRVARTITMEPPSGVDGGIVVLRGGRGQALVQASAHRGDLVLDTSADVSTYFAAALVRAVLSARHGSLAKPEDEVRQIDRGALSAWARPAVDVPSGAWRRAETSDARWCWLAVLMLLALEQWVRRGARPSEQMEHRDAAA
jgi:hypothetical protein